MSAIRFDRRDDVLVLTLDVPGDAVNKLTTALGEELSGAMAEIDRDTSVRACVIVSGKPDSFIVGADIEQFLEFRRELDAARASQAGQEVLNALAALRVPVVTAIHGACMGGGLELSLATTYRICTDHTKTLLAMPEVQLGLIPGMGGTQRLPRLIGLQAALDLMLTGRSVRARKALQLGLVDEMVHPAILLDVAVARARELADGTRRPARRGRGAGTTGLLLDTNFAGRAVVFRKARENVLAKTHGHFPAPLAALDAVHAGFERGMAEGLREEARRFGELAMTPVSRELIFLFFATTALKKDAGVEPPAPAAVPVRKLGVLGAGFMGAGIAGVAAQAGTLVRLKDTDPARVGRGLAAVRSVLGERLARRSITKQQFADQLLLVSGTTTYAGFGNADLVIEAVFEDLDLKHRVLREVEPAIRPDAVYASNTSTIPIGEIARAAARPERVLGMHFFSPVHRMPLLEVIVTAQTAKQAVVTAVDYGRALGKTVIVVHDGPGFYTTRTLSAYMNEAGMLLDENAAIEQVDRALVEFGFPVGPITLLDEVGIDVGGKVGLVLSQAFGHRMTPSQALRRVVESGRTGRKGGSGFYRYDKHGKKGTVDPTVYALIGEGRQRMPMPAGEMVERCTLAMVNEAAHCLQEGILRSPRDGDIGAVFGIGFPPFRGGPFRYIDSLGIDEVVRRLEDLHARFAPRFEPAALLLDMARARRRFYPADGRPV
ncbi:MAG TPA: fatty acid oxidation complex subunit alpha FadJ [Gemmatimonadaceae bacterium]|nr:fatty acid oxidation complex subunit alpha FadJ [Gemmatimonadaceae bacterium]